MHIKENYNYHSILIKAKQLTSSSLATRGFISIPAAVEYRLEGLLASPLFDELLRLENPRKIELIFCFASVPMVASFFMRLLFVC